MRDESKWFEVEPYGPTDGGDVGGDIQVGTAWCRRYARRLPTDPNLWQVLDDYYYTVADNDREGRDECDSTPNDIQNMTMVTICTDLDDPGSTEQDSDMSYEWVDTLKATDEAARAACARMRPEYL